jgi:hypothetical protein
MLDGATDLGPETGRAGDMASDLLGKAGWEIDRLALAEVDIAPCLGCFGCWVKTPGVCVIDDAGRDVARRMIRSDLLIFLTPLTFGGYSSQLKKAIDRLIPNILPHFRLVRGEVHHVRRYPQAPRLLGLGVIANGPVDPDEEELFETVVRRNAINLHAPSDGACVVVGSDTDETSLRTIERMIEAVIGS